MSEPTNRERPLLGILLMLCFTSLANSADAITKSFTAIYPVPQLLWIRFLGQTSALLFLLPWIGWRGLTSTSHLALQVLRGVLLLASAGFFVLALSLLPFSTANVLTFTSPLLVAVLSLPLLGEKVGLARAVAIVIGFLGVLIVIRPGFGGVRWAMLLPLITAFTYACYQLLTRRIAHLDGAFPSLFYVSLVGLLATSLAVPFFWQPLAAAWHLPFLLMMGCVVALGHFLQIQALLYAKASLIAPFGYASLLWSMMYGTLLFDERIDGPTIVGALLIAGCGIWLFRQAGR